MSSCYRDTFVLNKILFHVALLSFNLKTKRLPDESMYAASIFLFNLYTFFTSNPSIFGKFAIYSLSAAHDAIKITKNNWEIKTEKIFILSAFKQLVFREKQKKNNRWNHWNKLPAQFLKRAKTLFRLRFRGLNFITAEIQITKTISLYYQNS